MRDETDVEGEHSNVLLQLEQRKQTKSRAKVLFTRAWHKLLSLLGEDEAPSKDRVKQECEKMEAASDKIMIELFKLLELYAVCSDPVSVQQLTPEVEKN